MRSFVYAIAAVTSGTVVVMHIIFDSITWWTVIAAVVAVGSIGLSTMRD